MELKFLDTNIILRFLTQDHPVQSAAVLPIFKQLEEGTLAVTTSEPVIVEAVQVLSSRALYNLPRSEVQRHISTILSLKGLKLPAKRAYLRALDIYTSTNLDFVDALNVVHMERRGISAILSYDRDYDRIPSIVREEPGQGSGTS